MSNSFEDLNNNEQFDDFSNFDNSYNDDYDFISDYESVMDSIENPDPIDLLPQYDNETNFYDAIDNWDNEYEESITEKLAGKGKRSYSKFKEDENEFKKEFAEELAMLNDLLDEVNTFGKKLDKKFDAINGSKAKGTSKYLNDLIASILTSKTTKLQVLKEITAVKKSIQDLKIKAEGKKANVGDNGSLESSANSYFKEIMKVGRNTFVDNFNYDADTNISDATYSTDNDLEYVNSLPEAHNEIHNRISERLEEVGTDRRSEEGEKYIMYENMKVDLVIKFNVLNNDWEIVAIDKDERQIIDYPVPTKKDLGKIKFSSDNKYATDKYGRSYKVIEVYGS